MPYPKMLTAFGKTQSMADWAREVGMSYAVLKDRMRHGWDAEEALNRERADGRKVIRSPSAAMSTTNAKGQRKFSSYVGETIGRLTIDAYVSGRDSGTLRPVYRCTCSCGRKHEVTPYSLIYGNSRSCGCLASEGVSERNRQRTSHGMSREPVYAVWSAMLQRCHNEHDTAYPDYGGRGIHVCPSWRESFTAFYADMGPRPSGGTLERKNNADGYHKDNCVWASQLEQMNNVRRNRRITAFGKEQTVAQWSRGLVIPRPFIDYRLRKGLSLEQIVAEHQKSRQGVGQ